MTVTVQPPFSFPSANLRCYFVGDEPLGDPNITKVLPSDEETTMLSWEHIEIVEIHKRRYMLKDNALEIFLINGRTLLFAFTSTVVIFFLSLIHPLSLLHICIHTYTHAHMHTHMDLLLSLSPYSRSICQIPMNVCMICTVQERNNVHSQLLDLDLPNLDDSGENESEKLKQVTQR